MRPRIREGVLDVALADAVAREPEESCGYLLGTRLHGLTTYLPCLNSAPDPTNDFEIAALEQLRAGDFADEYRLELRGIVHSHPTSDATLSPSDLLTASNPVFEGWLWIAISLDTFSSSPAIRAWRVSVDAQPTEVDLKIH